MKVTVAIPNDYSMGLNKVCFELQGSNTRIIFVCVKESAKNQSYEEEILSVIHENLLTNEITFVGQITGKNLRDGYVCNVETTEMSHDLSDFKASITPYLERRMIMELNNCIKWEEPKEKHPLIFWPDLQLNKDAMVVYDL